MNAGHVRPVADFEVEADDHTALGLGQGSRAHALPFGVKQVDDDCRVCRINGGDDQTNNRDSQDPGAHRLLSRGYLPISLDPQLRELLPVPRMRKVLALSEYSQYPK